jgi:hypothetical protein
LDGAIRAVAWKEGCSMVDPGILANAVAIFLAPALPYLLNLGGKAGEEAAKKLGGEGWEKAKRLWQRLLPKVEGKETARGAAADLAAAPEDGDAVAQFRFQVKKLLEAEPALAEELARLLGPETAGTSYRAEVHGSGAVAQGEGAVAAGAGGMAFGGGAHGIRIGNVGPGAKGGGEDDPEGPGGDG